MRACFADGGGTEDRVLANQFESFWVEDVDNKLRITDVDRQCREYVVI